MIDNKIESAAFQVIKQERIDVPTLIDCKGNGKWVKWGKDNKMPNYLYDCYLQVSNLQSILEVYNDFICGNEIKSSYMYINDDNESIQDIVKKIIADYTIFGCFAIECIRNAKGDICEIYYQDARNIRINEDYTTAYLSNQWGSFTGKDVKELPLYNRKEKQTHFLYWNIGKSRGWYGTPLYFAAMKSIEILRRVREFHLNNLRNNFSVNAMVTFCNGIPSKTVQEEIREKLNNSFSGTENTSKLFVNFADNQESAPKVERLTEDKFGVLYKALSESSVDDVYQACRINPMLLGANVQTGFSRQEFNEVASLFQTTTISPIQRHIEKSFGELGLNIKIEKYVID